MLIIDVREPDEYNQGHVEGAVNIPVGEIAADIPAVANTPKESPIIVYCNSGRRSQRALDILSRQGFSNVKNGINQQTVSRYL